MLFYEGDCACKVDNVIFLTDKPTIMSKFSKVSMLKGHRIEVGLFVSSNTSCHI